MQILSDLEVMHFKKIGEYRNGDSFASSDIKKSERVSLAYIMIVDNIIMYVGKTIQGYRRPLGYKSFPEMKSVYNGITSQKLVDVYARRFDTYYPFEGLSLDLCEAYEQALIAKYQPPWNNHIQKLKNI